MQTLSIKYIDIGQKQNNINKIKVYQQTYPTTN